MNNYLPVVEIQFKKIRFLGQIISQEDKFDLSLDIENNQGQLSDIFNFFYQPFNELTQIQYTRSLRN